MFLLKVFTGKFVYPLKNIIYIRFNRCSDVINCWFSFSKGKNICINNIFNENIIAGLHTVTINKRLGIVYYLISKYCNNSALAVRILPGTVNICIPENQIIQPVCVI